MPHDDFFRAQKERRFAAEGPNRNSKDGCPCCRAVPKQFIRSGNLRGFSLWYATEASAEYQLRWARQGPEYQAGEGDLRTQKEMRYNDTDLQFLLMSALFK